MAKEHFTKEDRDNDPNYQAYLAAKSEGKFSELEQGAYVAFARGVLIAINTDLDKILTEVNTSNKNDPVFIHQVNEPERIYHLHRGPPLVQNRKEKNS